MKKLSVLVAAFAVLLIASSCSGSKEVRSSRKTIDGSWQLQTITTEGITGKIKAQVLDEADFNCFVGSSWKFNKNNSLGSYSIAANGTECAALTRNIRWSVVEENGVAKIFQYKRVDNKYKDMDEGKAGFRFTIVSLDDKTMQLRNDITFENKPAAFIYNFTRN